MSLIQGAGDLVSPILAGNVTATDVKDCLTTPPETATVTKAVYAIWVWAIYFTFPGKLLFQHVTISLIWVIFCRNLFNPASRDSADIWAQVRRLHLRLPLQRGYHQQPHHRPHEQGETTHFHQNVI